MWSGFRVARRARPFGLKIEEHENKLRVTCSHDGYMRLRGKPVHRREWRFFDNALEIEDTIEGALGEAVGRLYFHPSLLVEASRELGRVILLGRQVLHWQVAGASCRVSPTKYVPKFGLTLPNQCLEMRFFGPRCLIRLTWS